MTAKAEAILRGILFALPQKGRAPRAVHLNIEAKRVTGLPNDVAERAQDRQGGLMGIVLEHRYRDLIVGDDEFYVTLEFGGCRSALTIPFEAVSQVHFPDVGWFAKFGEADPLATGDKTSGQVVRLDDYRGGGR